MKALIVKLFRLLMPFLFKELEILLKEKDSHIVKLEATPVNHVVIRPPDEKNMLEFYRQVGSLLTNDFYLYYFEMMKKNIVEDFTLKGKENSEFFRGKLSTLADIFNDARSMQANYKVMTQTENKDAS